MHELIILGFLFDHELHGYQIKQQIDQLLAGIYSLSYGSLYPALKKLETQNYITSKTSFSYGGQEKIMYNITDKGKAYLITLMESVPTENYQLSWQRFQVKVLFFVYVDHKIIKNLQQSMIQKIQSEISKLEKANVENNNSKYAQYLMKKSLKDLKDNLNWLETLLNQ